MEPSSLEDPGLPVDSMDGVQAQMPAARRIAVKSPDIVVDVDLSIIRILIFKSCGQS